MADDPSHPAGQPMDVEHAADRLARLLADCRLGSRVEWHRAVTSTNEVARRAARAGAPDGTLVLAEEQTAGRGRRSRQWLSPAGKGIYLTAVLRPPGGDEDYPAAVQLAAGIAVAETTAPWCVSAPELRWPNDCHVAGRKIAGVLVEAETSGSGLEFLVCGIGLNVAQEAEDFPDEIRDDATSLRLVATEIPERVELAARLAGNLAAWDDVARHEGISPVRERWEQLAPGMLDRPVIVDTVDGTIEGRAAGLTDRGGLRVHDDEGIHEVLVGELARVRRYG